MITRTPETAAKANPILPERKGGHEENSTTRSLGGDCDRQERDDPINGDSCVERLQVPLKSRRYNGADIPWLTPSLPAATNPVIF